jgi:hypothetical protein
MISDMDMPAYSYETSDLNNVHIMPLDLQTAEHRYVSLFTEDRPLATENEGTSGLHCSFSKIISVVHNEQQKSVSRDIRLFMDCSFNDALNNSDYMASKNMLIYE